MSIASSRPSRVDGRAVPRPRRMALGRRHHVFRAAVDHLHGPAGFPREQRRVAGNHRRDILLCRRSRRPFPSARRGSARPAGRTAPPAPCGCSTGHCIDPHTVTPCTRIGDGEHAVRLDVELLLRAGLVLAFDDDRRRLANADSTSPLLTVIALEHVVGSPDDLAARVSASSIEQTAGSGSMSTVMCRRASSATARGRGARPEGSAPPR